MNYVIELYHQTTSPTYLTMYTWRVRCVCVCVCVCLRESSASVQERSSASTLPPSLSVPLWRTAGTHYARTRGDEQHHVVGSHDPRDVGGARRLGVLRRLLLRGFSQLERTQRTRADYAVSVA